MVDIVNVVGSGSLNVELDLERVANDLGSIAEYDPDKYPGIYLRFGEDDPLITLYRTGKYIVTGADSEEEAHTFQERFVDLLIENGMAERQDNEWFRIQNYVCTAELDRSLNLNALAIGLGLERTEYEPEQFPGLIYRPEGADGVVLLFATGRIVITGCRSVQAADDIYEEISKTIATVL